MTLPLLSYLHTSLSDSVVHDALRVLFPGAPANISPVLQFALASVVFHREFLRATLPKHHRLFSSILFRDEQLLGSFASRVLSGLPTPSGVLRATGIPPHVNIIEKMEAVQDDLHKILPAISNIPPEVVKGVDQLLMWQHCVCGDPGGTYPPLRDLKAKELPSRNLKKRLSDLNFLMNFKPIEAKLRADNLWKNPPSFEEASQMFLHGQTAIMPSVPNQRKRRYAEIHWRTVVNALRGPKRRVATDHDGPDDDN